MSDFTPGPWVIRFGANTITGTRYPYQVVNSDGAIITSWGAISRRAKLDGQANARLIAAAPEMYAVLASMRDVENDPMANGDPRRALLLEALDKAEGK